VTAPGWRGWCRQRMRMRRCRWRRCRGWHRGRHRGRRRVRRRGRHRHRHRRAGRRLPGRPVRAGWPAGAIANERTERIRRGGLA